MSTTTTAINVRFPAPFDDLDYKTGRDLAYEAFRLAEGHAELVTEDLLWDIRNGAYQCPECEAPMIDKGSLLGDHYGNCPHATIIPLTQFAPDHAADVSASRTPGCNGYVFVSVYDEGIELRVNGCCSIAGPPDDDDPRPNSGTITGLSPAEARELAARLLDAAASCEAKR